MTASANATPSSAHDRRAEVEDLKRDLLSVCLPAGFLTGWLWIYVAATHDVEPGIDMAVAVLLWVITCVNYRVKRRFYNLSVWLWLLSWMIPIIASASFFVPVQTIAFGVVVIVWACALLSGPHSLFATAALWLAVTLVVRPGPVNEVPGLRDVRAYAGVLYLGCWIVTRVSVGSLVRGLEAAVVARAQAEGELAEVRVRRGELNRLVHALEEATYRIQRMNSELLVARHEAELRQEFKSRFAAIVSHELRSPLNLVLGFAELMALSPERYGKSLTSAYYVDIDTIYRNTKHLVDLTDDILDLSRMKAGRLPLIKERTNILDVIEQATATVRPLIQHKGLYLREELTQGMPDILADPVRIRQVLLNLLTNAVRYTKQGGIVVRACGQDDAIVVTVQDTGPGISAEDLQNLFIEFSQLHSTETRASGGTGLGLAISKELVEAHGGRIWVDGQRGVGSSFSFSIPASSDDTRVSLLATSHVESKRISDCCLVAHNDASMVRYVARWLENFRVMGIPDPRDICSFVEGLHPRAIISSQDMASAITAQLSMTKCDVPVIACLSPDPITPACQDGVLGYLVKPTSIDAIRAIIAQVEHGEETTVLLVDDDPDAVRLMENLVMSIPGSYRILKALEGRHALSTMEEVVPDVVFIDLVMPGLSGYQVIQQMRGRGHLAEVPVVIVTGQDPLEERDYFGRSITLYHPNDIGTAQGFRYLAALVESVNPHYLSRPTESSAAESVGQKVSATPPLLPVLGRDQVG